MTIALAYQSNILDFPPSATVLPSKDNEWFTPSPYIEAARKVMGSIDLDPASCREANMVVRATRYFTQYDNGLIHEWKGNIWLNPPYSSLQSGTGMAGCQKGSQKKGPTSLFLSKLLRDFQSGNITQAVACVNADMVRTWFRPLWQFPICFSDHKICFFRPGRKKQGHFFPTCFVYLGPHEQKFIEIFGEFGDVAKRVSQPRHSIATPSLWEVSE